MTVKLTCTDTQIVSFTKMGMSARQVALKLNCSEQMVKNHKSRIMRQLGASNFIQAVSILE